MKARDPAARLCRALRRHAGTLPLTLTHGGVIPWASATFVGGRHRLTVTGEMLDTWLAGLDEAELPMPGCFVASVDVERTACGAVLTVLVLDE